MASYEVEFGQIIEHRDAETHDLLEVTVDIFVQQPTGVTEPGTGDYNVTFTIDGATATFQSLAGQGPVTQSGLVAVKAAATELQELQDVYTVEDPFGTLADTEYTVVSRTPT